MQVTSSAPRKLHYTREVEQQQQQTLHPPDMIKAPSESVEPLTTIQQQLSRAASAPSAASLPDMTRFTQEVLQQSQLLQLRPPLTPAKSGNDFYTVIPYQVLVDILFTAEI